MNRFPNEDLYLTLASMKKRVVGLVVPDVFVLCTSDIDDVDKRIEDRCAATNTKRTRYENYSDLHVAAELFNSNVSFENHNLSLFSDSLEMQDSIVNVVESFYKNRKFVMSDVAFLS